MNKSDAENYMQELGIGTTKNGQLSKGGQLIFESIEGAPKYLADIPYHIGGSNNASNFVARVWDAVEKRKTSEGVVNSTLGSAFECLVALVCCLEDITPFYMQAELSFVPNSKFDILLYDAQGWPISLSIKTSLRERYKQADLEAMAMKQVHRKAESFLITLNETEANVQSKKIEKRDLVALDKIILATSSDFDQLVSNLSKRTLIEPAPVPIISYTETLILGVSAVENNLSQTMEI